MTAFSNVIDLRFAVSDLVGDRAISDVFPRLVQMAELDFDSRLRTRHQLFDATLTFDGGVSALPPDFLEMYSVDNTPYSTSRRYSIDGFNINAAGMSGDVGAKYYARLPSLTCGGCNWLLEQYPTVYLYGVGIQAAKHLKNVEIATLISSLYSEAIKLLRVDDERARYSVSTVRVMGPTP